MLKAPVSSLLSVVLSLLLHRTDSQRSWFPLKVLITEARNWNQEELKKNIFFLLKKNNCVKCDMTFVIWLLSQGEETLNINQSLFLYVLHSLTKHRYWLTPSREMERQPQNKILKTDMLKKKESFTWAVRCKADTVGYFFLYSLHLSCLSAPLVSSVFGFSALPGGWRSFSLRGLWTRMQDMTGTLTVMLRGHSSLF